MNYLKHLLGFSRLTPVPKKFFVGASSTSADGLTQCRTNGLPREVLKIFLQGKFLFFWVWGATYKKNLF